MNNKDGIVTISDEEMTKVLNFINSKFNSKANLSLKVKNVKKLAQFLRDNNINLSCFDAAKIIDSSKPLYDTMDSLISFFNTLGDDNNIFNIINAYEIKAEELDEEHEEKSSLEKCFRSGRRNYFDASSYYRECISKFRVLTREEEVELSKRIQNGDEEAYNELVIHNLRLVYKYANKFKPGLLDFDDLVEEGNIGLMIAARKFDGNRGYKFSTYATHWILAKIERAIYDKEQAIRIPCHVQDKISKYLKIKKQYETENGREPSLEEIMTCTSLSEKEIKEVENSLSKTTISLSTPIGEEEESTLEDILISDEYDENITDNKLYIDQLISVIDNSNLSNREALVLYMRYGVGYPKSYTLEEIGAEFNLTRERIRQIEKSAFSKISRYFKKNNITLSL